MRIITKMGTPLCVLLPATTQLLLPLFISGFDISFTDRLFITKIKESAVGGVIGIIPGVSNTVPFGTIGLMNRVPADTSFLILLVKTDLALVYARSFSVPDDNILAIIFNNKAVLRFVHFSGLKFSNLYSRGDHFLLKKLCKR